MRRTLDEAPMFWQKTQRTKTISPSSRRVLESRERRISQRIKTFFLFINSKNVRGKRLLRVGTTSKEEFFGYENGFLSIYIPSDRGLRSVESKEEFMAETHSD